MSNKSSSSPSLICKDYLLLKPEETSFSDLLLFLVYNERKLVDCPSKFQEDVRKLNYRWIVVISALMMKLLQLMKTPMEYIGYLIETLMNLITNYGGLFNLLLNFIKGKVVMPNKSSEKYRSMIALLDNRVDLDPKIQPGHANYEASLSWMAAKLSYENSAFTKNVVENHWKMQLIDTYNFRNDMHKNNSTQAFMLRDTSKDKDLIVVAFRGTSPFDADDWSADIDISWYGLNKVGRVHGGFMKALGLQTYDEDVVGWPKEIELGNEKPQYAYYKIRQVLKDILKENKNAKFLLVGHSLGGALAILFASVLILHEEKELLEQLEGVYTFGQPRVGDEEFGDFMKKKLKAYNVKYCRYVYCNDMVPRLPYDGKTLLFKHFGPSLYYDSFYIGQELEEEPNKNYFSLQWMIPKYLNGGWELLRGLILPNMGWGPDYKEGWCERLFRVIGLVVPGLSAHGPQDYTNLTRLGQLSLPLDNHNTKFN
ncbi:putative feruloyl esterase A [Bienertia sinuspersici]